MFYKNISVIKNNEKLRIISRIKETNESSQLNAKHDSRMDPVLWGKNTVRDIIGTIDKWNVNCKVDIC